jgi:hypothetical protein
MNSERDIEEIRYGYRLVDFHHGKRTRRIRIHQIVAETFIGPCPPGKEVNHIDGNRENNDADNLEYVTPAENNRHGLCGIHSRAVLTPKDVKQIRKLKDQGARTKDVALQFGVTPATVCDVFKGRSWTWVK